MKSILFRVKKQYFNDIVSGKKTLELRNFTKYWRDKLVNTMQPPDIAVFACGRNIRKKIIRHIWVGTPITILGRQLTDDEKKVVTTNIIIATEVGGNITDDETDIKFMNYAFDYAQFHPDEHRRKTIGALVVKNGLIIGKGHRVRKTVDDKILTIHAEHMALNEAGNDAENATLYVTLEPCTKRFKADYCITPKPCCELITDAKIKRVVIANKDENFGGGGIDYLLEKGVDVAICEGFEQFKNLVQDDYFETEEDKKRYLTGNPCTSCPQ